MFIYVFISGCIVACGNLVPQPESKPMPPVVGAPSPNRWTTRKAPWNLFTSAGSDHGCNRGPHSSLWVSTFSWGLQGLRNLAWETLGPFWAQSAWLGGRYAGRDGVSICSSIWRTDVTLIWFGPLSDPAVMGQLERGVLNRIPPAHEWLGLGWEAAGFPVDQVPLSSQACSVLLGESAGRALCGYRGEEPIYQFQGVRSMAQGSLICSQRVLGVILWTGCLFARIQMFK